MSEAGVGGAARVGRPSDRTRWLPEIVLVLVSVVWGGTFLVTQIGMTQSGPFGLLAARFGLGCLTLVALFWRRALSFSSGELRAGLVIGLATFGVFALQTIGLQYITSSRSAFITALYVPTVPLLQLVLLRKAPRMAAWLGIAVAFTGLVVLTSGEGADGTFAFGEWLTLGSAACAALHIVLVSRWAPESDPIRLGIFQLGLVAVLSLLTMLLVGEPPPTPGGAFLLAVGSLGLLGTAFALAAMNWAQRTVSATAATLIYALEPVWAGLFGGLAGEAITGRTLVGSGLIVGGVVVGEVRRSAPAPIAPRAPAERSLES